MQQKAKRDPQIKSSFADIDVVFFAETLHASAVILGAVGGRRSGLVAAFLGRRLLGAHDALDKVEVLEKGRDHICG